MRGPQAQAHHVEGFRQVTQFIFRFDLDLVSEIAFREALCTSLQCSERHMNHAVDKRPG